MFSRVFIFSACMASGCGQLIDDGWLAVCVGLTVNVWQPAGVREGDGLPVVIVSPIIAL